LRGREGAKARRVATRFSGVFMALARGTRLPNP
jgi:hypothetical protein